MSVVITSSITFVWKTIKMIRKFYFNNTNNLLNFYAVQLLATLGGLQNVKNT